MDADVTKQILSNYKIFSEQAKKSSEADVKKKTSQQEDGADRKDNPKVGRNKKHRSNKVKRINKQRTGRTASHLLNISASSNSSRKGRRRTQAKDYAGTLSSNSRQVVQNKREGEEEYSFICLPQVQAIVTTMSGETTPHKKAVPLPLKRLESELKCLEKSSPLDDVTEQIMGENGPIADIVPKVLDFMCTDADKETDASILLTNNTDEMELFKIKTTNPYLFRVQPSTGYLYPKETLEIQITLLEGVDVKCDRFLVMVAEIGKENHVETMTNAELVKLWRSRHINQWSYVYQEKIGCRCLGSFRPRSKRLISAFRPDPLAMTDNNTQGTPPQVVIAKSLPTECKNLPNPSENAQPCRPSADNDDSVRIHQQNCELFLDKELMERSQSHTLSDIHSDVIYEELTDSTSMALVPYQPPLNRNANANIDEWLNSVPGNQKAMVREIFDELADIKHQMHNAKRALDNMRSAIIEFEPMTKRLDNRQQALKDESDVVTNYVKKLAAEVKGHGKRITAEQLKAQFMSEVEILNRGIDEVITQHEEIWRRLKHHDRIIGEMKNKNNSNKLTHDEGNMDESDQERYNRSQNARLERHHIYDERRDENNKMRDLEESQAKLGQQLTEMAGNVSGLSRRAQTMTDVLKNVTSELKQQRKDSLGDVSKLEMKYLEQCALLPLQDLGRQNQDMLGNLYSSFMAHIEKITHSLDKLTTEHRALSHFIDHQTLDFNKLKKGICEMGKGIQSEHQHILTVTAANTKRFDKLELYQTLLENHMKDIHTALKSIMEKTKVIAQRTNNLEHDAAVQRRDWEDKINDMRKASVVAINDDGGKFDSLFETMKDRLDDVMNEIRRLKDQATQNEGSLRELATSLRQHKDQTASQMTSLEQRTNAQIESQLQEARRNFDNLKAKIAGFQGTLKGMDGLLMTANEKLKSLYGDLERYKKTVTEEMQRLAKEIADAAERQMAEIAKTHGAMKKQIEGLLNSLSKAQMDAKAISARITEIENELNKKHGNLMAEIKKAHRDAQTTLAIRAQKLELFHTKAEEDLKNLADELQALREAAALLAGKMDDLENRTRQKLDDTKAALEDINARIEQLTSVILDEFYNKMQRAAERLQEQLNQLENHMTHYVDSKIEELARKQANAARDQLAEIYLKMEHSDRLAEAVRLQIDKNFYLLIMLLILIPMFMYSAYMGRTMRSPMNQVSAWWNSCCGNFFLGKRNRAEL